MDLYSELITDYSIGLTPNPDVLCNSLIKFDKFLDYGLTELRGDAIATGHYANSSFGKYLENYSATESKKTYLVLILLPINCSLSDVKLLKPSDSFKDQTLFLSQISQAALRKTMLPLGNKKKAEVKQIAKEIGLDFLLKKKESTGICFIGTRNFQDFISDYIDDKEGDFVDIDTGKVVGKHRGIHKWTVGQGCKIGGVKKPYFIAEKYRETNIILIAEGTEHPSLFSDELVTSSIHLVDPKNEELLNEEVACQFRFQHTKNLVNCVVTKVGANLRVKLEKPLRALTPGQYSVFYRGNECLGSARIVERRIMYNLNRLNLKYQVQ